MAQISHAEKEIKLKIVYYGPALSGKTTNLIYIHQVLFPNQAVKLFSINTGDDRTLFFDLLPLELGRVNGYDLKLQLFTVPGQVRYNQTRRAVLSKTDGVVFVADSQKGFEDSNLESYTNLKENLALNRLPYASIPLIIQYNKQDLDGIHPVEALDRQLNDRRVPSFGAIAITGVGVLQTLKQSILQVLGQFSRTFPEFPVSEIEDRIDRSFEAVLDAYQQGSRATAPVAEPETAFREKLQASAHNIKVRESRDEISQAELLEKAVETNIEMAELYNALNTTKNQLEQKSRELTILTQVTQALVEPFDPEQLPRMLFKSVLMTFQTSYGSILRLNPGTDGFQELFISGFSKDPLDSLAMSGSDSLARHLFEQQKPYFFNAFSFDADALPGLPPAELAEQLKKRHIMAFMSVPLRAAETQFGLVTLYQLINEASVLKAYGAEEVRFLNRLGAVISLAFERMEQAKRVQAADSQADTLIAERTAAIEQQAHTLSAQNADYQNRLHKLETLLVPIVRMDQERYQRLQTFRTDISKPLSSVLTAGKILEKFGVTSKDNLDKFLEVLREESARLNQVLAGFEAATTRYFQPADFVEGSFPLSELLAKVRDLYLPVIKMKRLEFREDIPDELPNVLGDRHKLQYVLNQLVENALQFTSSGYLEIRAQFNPVLNDRFMVVSVADTGSGISRENLPRIFERFFREAGDFGTQQVNFGLGLAFSKEIIEHYSGRIWAKSEEGLGTTVYVELPVHQRGR